MSRTNFDAMMVNLNVPYTKSSCLTISDLYTSSIKRGVDFLENGKLNPKEIALYISSVVELHKILFPEVNA